MLRAARSVANVGVAAAGAAGALALHSWPILALGGAAYAAMVAWDVVTGRGPAPSPPPEGRAALEPWTRARDLSTRDAACAILAARAELDRVLTETPAEVEIHLALALVSVDELLQRAAQLASRADDLASYLATRDPRVVEGDVRSLTQRVANTPDPAAKAEYEHALAARRDHLQVLQDLESARDRAVASLTSIRSTLEALPAKVVRMRTLDAQAMDALTGDVKEELDRMNGEISTFEQTLKSMGEMAR